MNGIWVPIAVTLLMLVLVIWDIKDEWEQFKKEWLFASLVLCIKPGLLIAASWVVWSAFN